MLLSYGSDVSQSLFFFHTFVYLFIYTCECHCYIYSYERCLLTSIFILRYTIRYVHIRNCWHLHYIIVHNTWIYGIEVSNRAYINTWLNIFIEVKLRIKKIKCFSFNLFLFTICKYLNKISLEWQSMSLWVVIRKRWVWYKKLRL